MIIYWIQIKISTSLMSEQSKSTHNVQIYSGILKHPPLPHGHSPGNWGAARRGSLGIYVLRLIH